MRWTDDDADLWNVRRDDDGSVHVYIELWKVVFVCFVLAVLIVAMAWVPR